MPYVARNQLGSIDCLFGNEQPGVAEEFLPDDDPEVVAYLTPKPQPDNVVLYDHENRIRALEGQPPLTPEEFMSKIIGRGTNR
jgi:hypothetical protein